MSRKPIIVFEGVEGSGKSLHINYVANHLKKNNKSNFHKVTDLLLYFASRNENIEKIIRKNIKKKIILIDRFIDSTIAYQHYGMGIDLNFINSVNKFLLKNIKPNFTFLNLVSKKNMKLRLSRRKKNNRYDKFKSKFYNRLQSGFIKIANKNKKKYLKINSNLDISINKEIIISMISKLI